MAGRSPALTEGPGETRVGPIRPVLRLVLDTNVWLDWLVFDEPLAAPIKIAVRDGSAGIFIDSHCEDELVRVLAYPLRRSALASAEQAACLAECRRSAHRIGDGLLPDGAARARLPVCRDPDDQKFLDLALACRADFLVTRDLALLDLARRIGRSAAFRIVDLARINVALAAS